MCLEVVAVFVIRRLLLLYVVQDCRFLLSRVCCCLSRLFGVVVCVVACFCCMVVCGSVFFCC